MEWNERLSDELHKQVRQHYPRRHCIVTSLDQIWGCDILQLDRLSRSNKGFKYVLVCVDLFSRYAWLRALKHKNQKETTKAFEDIFNEAKPSRVWSDLGKEFLNKSLKSLFDKNKISIYHTYSRNKSVYSERLIRSLKLWLWKFFTFTDKSKWIDFLPELNKFYNNRKHRTIGMTPTEARLPINNYKVMSRNLKKSKANIGKRVFSQVYQR